MGSLSFFFLSCEFMFLNDINLHVSIAGKNKFLPFFNYFNYLIIICGVKQDIILLLKS